MKKILTFVLILVVLGPTVLLACDCCSMGEPQSGSSIPAFSASCDCCNVPQMEQNRQTSALNSFFTSEFMRHAVSFVVPSAEVVIERDTVSPVVSAASPPFSSPLYLSLQVLRI